MTLEVKASGLKHFAIKLGISNRLTNDLREVIAPYNPSQRCIKYILNICLKQYGNKKENLENTPSHFTVFKIAKRIILQGVPKKTEPA